MEEERDRLIVEEANEGSKNEVEMKPFVDTHTKLLFIDNNPLSITHTYFITLLITQSYVLHNPLSIHILNSYSYHLSFIY